MSLPGVAVMMSTPFLRAFRAGGTGMPPTSRRISRLGAVRCFLNSSSCSCVCCASSRVGSIMIANGPRLQYIPHERTSGDSWKATSVWTHPLRPADPAAPSVVSAMGAAEMGL